MKNVENYMRKMNYEILVHRGLGRNSRQGNSAITQYSGLCHQEDGFRHAKFSVEKIQAALKKSIEKLINHGKIDAETKEKLQLYLRKVDYCYESIQFDQVVTAVLDLTNEYKEDLFSI